MSPVKQVKVDNWGIYFLQRLKHFFNRTDFCDLTLQFQDNAQLKVHRLVLNACTEYFEVLERTCEMYEDCLVMPDDLQADVVVPIVNFMYTGQLEFPMDLLEKLYQTSEIMNMTVLTKLLDSHRTKWTQSPRTPNNSYPAVKRTYKPPSEVNPVITQTEITKTVGPSKRSYTKSFEKNVVIYKDKKYFSTANKKSMAVTNQGVVYKPPSPIPLDNTKFTKKTVTGDPRPTRYELPEELDTENVFENSFCNISYTSQPLMIHPETRKQYTKRPRNTNAASSSKKYGTTSTIDIVQCKPTRKDHDSLFDDTMSDRIHDECEMFPQYVKMERKDPSQLFDEILDQTAEEEEREKVTIESKNKKTNVANLDHAKIISEVLKKYPHLVKSNKNIKLKILNTSAKNTKKPKKSSPAPVTKSANLKTETESDFTYETDVLDSKQAAKLIALGAENIEGPWICLICGTPGKALHFTSYYQYRRHLVEVHFEKPVLTICEYCGQKLNKRNYLLHHMYTKHGVEPPPQYHFPKCNQCNYIALTEALLIKHKLSHNHNEMRYSQHESIQIKTKPSSDGKSLLLQCNVCPATFSTAGELMHHLQNALHKIKKNNLQCTYCKRVFTREGNFYAHLKLQHKTAALRDGFIDESDDESQKESEYVSNQVKNEAPVNEYEEVDVQYQIEQNSDGNIHIVTKKRNQPVKRKILNPGFNIQNETPKKVTKLASNAHNEFIQETLSPVVTDQQEEEIVIIGNNEYVVKGNTIVPRNPKQDIREYIIKSKPMETPSTSVTYSEVQTTSASGNIQQDTVVLKNSTNLSQSIPIYVSNEEEYKALMSTNHPIIFDAGDANKTLTVLTTPHTGSLETTTIDLDNTQPNDMMIIQDEYNNLNVSQAVPSENSNIVVVYSDQINNQSKEYQILTTEGLQSQFVQSSAIITQNYETVTTTTPVMSAHVLDANVDGVWQGEQVIHHNLGGENVELSNGNQLRESQSQQIKILNTNDLTAEMTELPQVQLLPNANETAELVQIIPTTGESNQVVQIIPTTASEIMQILPTTSEESHIVDVIPNTQSEQTLKTINNSNEPNKEIQIVTGPLEILPMSQGLAEQEQITDNTISNDIEMSCEDQQQEDSNKLMTDDQPQNVSTMSIDAEIQPETSAVASTISINLANTENVYHQESLIGEHEIALQPNTEIEDTDKIIQTADNIQTQQVLNEEKFAEIPITEPEETLKEEIAEITCDDIHTAETQQVVEDSINEETEIPKPEETVVTKVIDPVEKIQTLTSEWSEEDSETTSQDLPADNAISEEVTSEVEESIENIQEEVVKHMIQTQEVVKKNNDNVISEENGVKTCNSEVVVTSLLNDWEDNETQEETFNDTENVIELNKSTETASSHNDAQEPTNDIEKIDNIKHLVSDWDEEDEENK